MRKCPACVGVPMRRPWPWLRGETLPRVSRARLMTPGWSLASIPTQIYRHTIGSGEAQGMGRD